MIIGAYDGYVLQFKYYSSIYFEHVYNGFYGIGKHNDEIMIANIIKDFI